MWSTLVSYAALLAITAGLTVYYNPQLLRKVQIPQAVEKQIQKKKTKRTHVSRVDGEDKGTSTPVSANETPSKKRKIVSAPVEDTVKVITTKGGNTTIPRDEDDDLSNREFAQQLAKAQAGTKLEKKSNQKERSRTVKPGKAVESPSLSATSSARDGDDDMSPVGSPPSGPVSTAPTSRAGDISDMLEAPVAKPNTLRLTDIPESKPKQAPKQVEQSLTKKQRQRQREAEQKRQVNEQTERNRKMMMEKQIKGARTAAGTSNQTKSNAFTPQSVWKKEEVTPQPASLLDTFEPAEGVTTKPLSDITNGVNLQAAKETDEDKVAAKGASSRERPEVTRERSWADEMSGLEEANANWEKELVQEEKWESVTSKKGKSKKKSDTGSDSSVRPNGVKTETQNRFQGMGTGDLEA